MILLNTRYKDFGEAIKRCTLEELVSIVRRHSHGFAKGTSSFKGVSFGPSGELMCKCPAASSWDGAPSRDQPEEDAVAGRLALAEMKEVIFAPLQVTLMCG